MRNFNDRRLFFDTNILLDIACGERPQSEEACEVLRRCNGSGDMGLVTPMSLKDAYYVLERQYGEETARKLVRFFTEMLVIVPCGQEECVLSLDSGEPDFEDGLVRACAELNDAAYILTRDADAFAGSPVSAVTCAEYLETLA